MKKNSFVVLFMFNVFLGSSQTNGLKKNYLNREDICCYVGTEIIKWNIDFNLKAKTYNLKIVHKDYCYHMCTMTLKFNGIFYINADTINLIDFRNKNEIKYLIKNDSLKVPFISEKYKKLANKSDTLIHYYYKYKLDLIAKEKYKEINKLKSNK